MKIAPIQNQIFKGHAAGPIKALYMQNATYPAQACVFNELQIIGRRHNFDVFIQNQDRVYDAIPIGPMQEFDGCIWAQDNKVIMGEDDNKTVISGLYLRPNEEAFAHSLSATKGWEWTDAEIYSQGGNMYTGKRPDGTRYLIVGLKDIELTALHYYLKNKLNKVTYDNMSVFIKNNELKNSQGEIVATAEEFSRSFADNIEIALEKYSDAFRVDKKDITILPQGDYHIDLSIKPLNYPYVLVNDKEAARSNLRRARINFLPNLDQQVYLSRMESALKKYIKEYAPCDQICERLKAQGFEPIKIGGGYGNRTVNFINAIVHQEKDGLIYITNSAEPEKYGIYLQETFEKELKEKCPQITKVYFVRGAQIGKHSNILMEYLKQYRGGIHCLCCEEMDE